ncbi:hypothetical protein TPENAI_60767 [Tenacibaculum litopenaei]|uniref:hypothetical protein n=1 Tax=Tenacibaculum litopenaei TaxID=396016 RepID=UPI003895E7EB
MLTYNLDYLKNDPHRPSFGTGGFKPVDFDLGGLDLDGIKSSIDEIIDEVINAIEKVIEIPDFIEDAVKFIADLFDGCASDWDMDALMKEQIKLAQDEINTAIGFMQNKSIGTFAQRLTRADKYLRYCVHDHWFLGEKQRKCGKNKAAEAIKYKIVNDYMWALRNKFKHVYNYTVVKHPYTERIKSPEGRMHNTDYWKYTTQKPNAKAELEKMKIDVNVTTDTTSDSSTSKPPTTPPPPKTDGKSDFGLIALVLLVVGLVGAGVTYLFKKVKPKKRK